MEEVAMIDDFGPSGTPPMIGKMLTPMEWLGYIASYQFGPVMPSKVVLHHTWRPTVAQWQGSTSMQGMQRFFATKGWTAAPHFFAGPDGIWLFTPMRELGVHAGAGNGNFFKGWYSLGLEMVGDYDAARPNGKVWEHTLAILGGIALRLGITPKQLISFHRDYSSKTCPGKAVSLDWVVAEVDAWLKKTTKLPDIKPGAIGTPAPTIVQLQNTLIQTAWGMRGDAFDAISPFTQTAVEQYLGMPIAKSRQATFNNKSYTIVPYALDTLFMEVGWNRPGSMWQTIGDTIPAEKTFERFLLDETLRIGGTGFRPENPFHLFLFANRDIGAPLAPPAMLEISGQMYVFQVFAGDTVYVRGNDPTNVDWKKMARVSDLGGMIVDWAVTLRDTLLAETYRLMKITYAPTQQLHLLARTWAVGSPLGVSSPLKIGNDQYVYQVYAHDVLFSKVPNWNVVHRLGTLMASARRKNPIGSL
jgi:hypothetical protein